ncbi:MAG: hypothetical protein ACRCU5_10180 [Rhizobiaceae bacterium]
MIEDNPLPERLKSELDPGEAVIWFGRPVSFWTHLLRSVLPFSLGLFGLLFLYDTLSFPDGTTRVNNEIVSNRDAFEKMLPLMVVMAWLSFGVFSPILTLLGARKTVYAITNKRLLAITGLRQSTVQTWRLDRLAGIERRSGYLGVGDIYFAIQASTPAVFAGLFKSLGFLGISYVSVEFLGVARAIEVEKIVRAAAADFVTDEKK